MKKTTIATMTTMVVLTAIIGCAYLLIKNNFGWFVTDEVTYSLVDFLVLTSKYNNIVNSLRLAFDISCCMTGIVGLINIGINWICEEEGIQA